MNTLLTKASYIKNANTRELKNLKIAYEAACESIVLLENDGSLPILTKKVALYGAGASHTIKGGTGSGEVNERHSITVLEGMENAGFEITTKKWIDDYQSLYHEGENVFKKNKYKTVLKNPMSFMMDYPGTDGRIITDQDIKESDTDYCIYVLSRQAGEGVDRRAEKGEGKPVLLHRFRCAEHLPESAADPGAGFSRRGHCHLDGDLRDFDAERHLPDPLPKRSIMFPGRAENRLARVLSARIPGTWVFKNPLDYVIM